MISPVRIILVRTGVFFSLDQVIADRRHYKTLCRLKRDIFKALLQRCAERSFVVSVF